MDKTWVVEIDADACSEATYDDFSVEGHAESIGSDDFSVLDFPRTENAQATYADHGTMVARTGVCKIACVYENYRWCVSSS